MSNKFLIITPCWTFGDGVGHDIEGVVNLLESQGNEVFVYASHYDSRFVNYKLEISEAETLASSPSVMMIYNHSIYYPIGLELLKASKNSVRIMRYHNVTWPHLFEKYDSAWFDVTLKGRLETGDIARYCTHFSVPSAYDARDLVHHGVNLNDIHYTPYFHKLSDFDATKEDEVIAQSLESDKRLHVMFLGRRVANKGHKHLLQVVSRYKELYDNDIVLHLIGGSDDSMKKYYDEMQNIIDSNSLELNVKIYDKLSFPEIVAFYKRCDVFLCMSEHEGFCIPVIEAQYVGTPVVAYYYGGVPEALGDEQLHFSSINYDLFAKAIRRIHTEPELAQYLSKSAIRNVNKRFHIDDVRRSFAKFIEGIVPIAGSTANTYTEITKKKKLAFVTPRFGNKVSGGGEYIARMVAEKLAHYYDIEVVTTQAETLEWDNNLKQEEVVELDSGISYKVTRLSNTHMRDWDSFHEHTQRYLNGDCSFAKFMDSQGPSNDEIVTYLENIQVDAYISWIYLFNPTLQLAQLNTNKPKIMVPYYHEETYFYLDGTKEVADEYDAFVFMTELEKKFATEQLNIESKTSIVLGSGIENESSLEKYDSCNNKVEVDLNAPFVLYVGRLEPAKGVGQLVENFINYKKENPGPLKLFLIGKKDVHLNIPIHMDIVELGFVSESVKMATISNALALINPSEFESLSLVLLESWALKTPVIVNENCSVMREQCRKSNGGLFYSNSREFKLVLDFALNNPVKMKSIGLQGYDFYIKNYRWKHITNKLIQFVDDQIALHS